MSAQHHKTRGTRTIKRRYHIALVYNGYVAATPEAPEDRGGSADLRGMIRRMARILRRLGYKVTVVPLASNLSQFQHRLRRLRPDVVFNQYEDVVHGALYDMRLAALVQMMGFPMTGSPALALGLTRYKFLTASLLQGAGIPIPPRTELLERIMEVDQRKWEFPVIVQPSREDAGIGLDRDSVVYSKKALKAKVRESLRVYHQPALAQRFLPGREFNVSIVGGRKLTVLPLAEVDYTGMPESIPCMMSYAAKWIEGSVEYENTGVVCPATVEPALAREISSIALRAFRAVGAWSYARVDMRLDEAGQPHVLEVNCNPSLEEDVAIARSAKQAGIEYPQLLDMIVRIALEGPAFDVGVPMF
jgi:D-alanine-D-alanine ligase